MCGYTKVDGHIQSCSAYVSYIKLLVFVGGVRPKVEILTTRCVSLRLSLYWDVEINTCVRIFS